MPSPTINNDWIVGLLAGHYGLSGNVVIAPIHNGEWNHVYRIAAERDVVLRISHGRKRAAQLEFELDVMTTLAAQLPFVPRIEPTVDGRRWLCIDGRLCTLFELMAGTAPQHGVATSAQAGRALGQIHRALAGQPLRLVNDLSLIGFDWHNNYLFEGDPLAAAAHLGADLPLLRRLRGVLTTWLDGCRRERRFAEGVVHGDYYRRNLLVAEGRISGVIDWDETVTSWLQYEVANAAWEFARDDRRQQHDARRFDAFLAAYAKQNGSLPLTAVDLTRLIGVRRLIEISLDLFEMQRGGEHDPDYCQLNIAYLKRLDLQLP